MKKTKIVIPARLKSTRLPGKPLKKILGKEMIIRVSDICNKVVQKKDIVIATDNFSIKGICQKQGYPSIMTSKKCKTGTDRVYKAIQGVKTDIIINVQGDEPMISPSDIKKVINAKKKFYNHVVCGYCEISYKDAESNNVPKVVINRNSELQYISRSLIPGLKNKKDAKKIKYFKQVCIYGFNKKELSKFYNYQGKSKIENMEDIEILRFFDLKIPIKMVRVSSKSISVDTIKDLNRVKKVLKKRL